MRAIWQREDACGGHDETGTSNGSDRDTETKEVQQRLERRAGRRTAVIRAAADGACLVHHEARRDGVAGEPALDPVRAARAARHHRKQQLRRLCASNCSSQKPGKGREGPNPDQDPDQDQDQDQDQDPVAEESQGGTLRREGGGFSEAWEGKGEGAKKLAL